MFCLNWTEIVKTIYWKISKGIQTIITCTGLEEFVKNGININQTFEIVQGKINGN